MDEKTDLRIKAKSIRKGLDIGNISQKLVDKIRQNDDYINAKNILIYYPKVYEINFLALLNDDKCFYLPKVNGKDLFVCPYKCGDILKKSDFNIEEPCSEPVDGIIIDLAIVPALAVDKKNIRLGYGGGFYDRFLAKYPNIKTIVALPEQLCFNKLPSENFDIPVDIVIKC